MMVGARGKYWTQLVSTIQSDFSKNKQTTQISKKKIRGVRQISLFLVIALVGYTIYASVNSLANSLDNRVASAVSNIIDSIQSSSSIDNVSNIPADTSSTSTTIADSTTTTVPIVTTTTVTSTTTTVPINTTIASSTASSRSNVYELNLLTQNVDFQEIYLKTGSQMLQFIKSFNGKKELNLNSHLYMISMLTKFMLTALT